MSLSPRERDEARGIILEVAVLANWATAQLPGNVVGVYHGRAGGAFLVGVIGHVLDMARRSLVWYAASLGSR